MNSDDAPKVLETIQACWPGYFDGAKAYYESTDDTVRIANEVSYMTVAIDRQEPARLVMVSGATLIGKEHGYGRLPYPVKDPMTPPKAAS